MTSINTWKMWRSLIRREVTLLIRNRNTMILTAIFFIQVTALFPLGLDPEPELLQTVGQAVIPVCALLSNMLMFNLFFNDDYQDGSLIDLLLLPTSPLWFVYAKVIAHISVSGLLVALLAPIMAIQYQFDIAMTLRTALAMLMLAPVLSSLGALSAALTLGLRNAHVLPALIYLPLAVPALIFAMLALGRNHAADWYLLAAVMLAALFFLPIVTAAAIRWSVS